ncbi:MAG: TSUP family transporter [Nitriliruptorales bacterium]
MARVLDAGPVTARLALPSGTARRLVVVAMVCLAAVAASTALTLPRTGLTELVLPAVVVAAFTLQLMDASAGMGFGTALAPLLIALGYEPLQVVPVLLIAQSLAGLISGAVHHELRNVNFSFRPASAATRVAALLAGVGIVSSVVAVLVVYLAIEMSAAFITTYVAILIFGMAAVYLLQLWVARRRRTVTRYPRPRLLVVFAAIAGVNKGIGGGGYGPVVALGQMISGIYSKSAVAIVVLAEGLVSAVGALTYVALTAAGVGLDLVLLPSVLAGGLLGAVAAPYLVRVVPNRWFAPIVPIYAIVIGIVVLTRLGG